VSKTLGTWAPQSTWGAYRECLPNVIDLLTPLTCKSRKEETKSVTCCSNYTSGAVP